MSNGQLNNTKDFISRTIKYIDGLFGFKSFKSRIVATLSLNLFILLLALLAYIYFHSKNQIELLAGEDATKMAITIGKSIETMMLTGNNELLEDFRKGLLGKKQISELIIYPAEATKDFKDLENKISNDEKVKSAILSGKELQEDVSVEGVPHIRTLLPLIASEKCITCHTRAKVGSVLGVVDTIVSVERARERHLKFIRTLFAIAPIIVLAVVLILFFVTRETIVRPISEITSIAEEIAEGKIENVSLVIDSKDEIAHLKEYFNRIAKGLYGLLVQSDEVGKGILDAHLVEEKLKQGLPLEKALSEVQQSKITESQQRGITLYKGKLGENFRAMKNILRMLTVQARAIAQDNLYSPALEMKIKGELGEAFSQMTENLKQSARTSERIAEGDLSANMTVSSKDAVTSNAYAKMVGNLKNLVQQINQTANAVTSSSQGLAQISEQTSQTMTQTASVITQITQSTTSIAQSAQVASVSSQQAAEISRKGRKLADNLLGKMQIIQTTVSKSEGAIENLAGRSTKIGEIVGVITKIAEQTNLLSLNAAIEAARAGESGRGFAVVADEIRKLAEHSATSAQEISKLVSEIQAETGSAVKATEQAAKEVEEGGKLMLDTDKGLAEILSSVENVTRQVEQIAAAAEELAASTEEASASSEEQTAAIEEVASSAQTLSQTAVGLKELVAKFKV